MRSETAGRWDAGKGHICLPPYRFISPTVSLISTAQQREEGGKGKQLGLKSYTQTIFLLQLAALNEDD